ncbi:MAG: hypothetical protein M1479_08345, partial [Actinobacteria bacterium]|nr:hypothetical protein [Actinomycetota bacterium]
MESYDEIINPTIELIKIDSRNKPHAEDRITDYILKNFSSLNLNFKIINHENHRKSLLAVFPGEF